MVIPVFWPKPCRKWVSKRKYSLISCQVFSNLVRRYRRTFRAVKLAKWRFQKVLNKRVPLIVANVVTNPVHELTPTHHIVSCTTLQLHITHGLHFPSTIALITQLSPITHLHYHTDALRQACFISLGLHLSHCEVCLAPSDISERLPLVCFTVYYLDCFMTLSVYPSVFHCLLPGLFLQLWPFAACLWPLPAFDILSVCCLPRP